MRNQILAKALDALKKVQDKEGNVFKSDRLSPKSITVLKGNGYLFSIIKGWYCIQSPATRAGDTTVWNINAWLFFSKYLRDRFGKNGYCLNTHDSLMLHTEKNTIPKQLTVIIKKGVSTSLTTLPNDTSLFVYEDKKNFPKVMDSKREVNVLRLEEVLCKSDTKSFCKNPLEMEIALKSIRGVSLLIESLITLKRMDTSAARLSGAYSHLGRTDDARYIRETYTALTGVKITPFNPFETQAPIFGAMQLDKSPYTARIQDLWNRYASIIEEASLNTECKPINTQSVLAELEEKYTQDAYHSLSIEGYKVTTELIEKIKHGEWNPAQNEEDRETRSALAAKGYYEAFETLKTHIIESLDKKQKIEDDMSNIQATLYRKLFLPSVQANIINASDLIGYRNTAIYLSGSEHVPPPKEAVLDSMEVYLKMLKESDSVLSKAVLGHFIFGFIHPYIDGNGRISRFIMNSILVSHGLPWITIKQEEREKYMHALEQASNHDDITPFLSLIKAKIKQE